MCSLSGGRFELGMVTVISIKAECSARDDGRSRPGFENFAGRGFAEMELGGHRATAYGLAIS
jgi:hypothetical protein